MNMDRPRRWLVLPVMLLVAVALGLLALLLVKANPAEGALPVNGRFVFENTAFTAENPEGDAEIYTINHDGTDIRQITSNDVDDLQTAWSPDARKIVFVSYRNPYSEIYTMDADGNNLKRLTTGGSLGNPRLDPAWSPDGTQIAFATDGPDGIEDIFVMDAEGNHMTNLTADFGSGRGRAPAWSPDGNQIAFVTNRHDNTYDIYKMDAVDNNGDGNGDNMTRLTNNDAIPQFLTDNLPDWSPDGNQIAFTRNRDGNTEIYRMDAVDNNGDGNGDNMTRLTFFDTISSLPHWSPDGQQIAFTKREVHDHLVNVIYTMDANGENQTLVPNTDANSLDWGVVPPPPSIDSVNQEAAAGETVSTTNGAEPTASDPIASRVTTPLAGNVSIKESPPPFTETPLEPAYTFFGQQVNISVPGPSSSDNPYKLEFSLDSSLIPPGENADTIQLFRNGVRLLDCTGAEGTAEPDPCVSSRTQLGSNGDVKITAYTSDASSWNFGRLSDQAVNHAPVAVDDTATTDEDTDAVIDVLSNDTDADGDSLSVVSSSLSHPAHGTVELITSGTDAGKVRYTPTEANYNGSDNFNYKANDGTADSNEATVSVTVTAVNDAPVAVNDSYSTNQGNVLTVNAPGVLSNDTDVDSANLTAARVTGPANGQLTLNANGSFTYTPNAGFSGSDSFTYKANDGSVDSNTATVTITVNPVGTPAPMVGPVSPEDQATDVLRSTKVTATFNVAMKPSSLTNLKSKKSKTFILTGPGKKGPTQVSATVTCNNLCTTATLSPSKTLAANTTYTATVKGTVEDASGRKLGSDYVWRFTTGG